MAHFAQLNENDIVINVVVVADKRTTNAEGVEDEAIGASFLKGLYGAKTKWVKTSYNSNIRGRYAGIGFTYDRENDRFVPPKPYDSWVLNETTVEWEAPISDPEPKYGPRGLPLIFWWNEEQYQSTDDGWEFPVIPEGGIPLPPGVPDPNA
jgi:hypothetical protein